MQNKLQYLAVLFFALLLFVLNGFTAELYSQIVLNNDRTKEILFSEQTDRERRSGAVISLKNYSNILSDGLNIIDDEWSSVSDTQNSSPYLFSKNSDGYVSPGSIRIEGIEERVENAFSLKNGSSNNFGRLNISTDFIVRNSDSSDEMSLVLRIKNPDGKWVDAGRGIFLPDAEKNEQSFSIQITVSDVFIQKDETLDLMWVNRSLEEDGQKIFTQRIEITPEYSDTFPFQRGDLLITELLPMGDVDGYAFEYLELYNPDDVAKPLKGVSIQTNDGVHTIQSDIEIPAYGYYIFSNADFSDIEKVDNSYFYSDKRLFSDSESNGRVQITKNGDVIASAVYESAEVNISFESERMSQSVDGYTGLQNLKRSDSSFMAEVNGSPGESGSSVPVYHKSFSEAGIHLIAIPGRFYSNIVRIQNAVFYSIDGNPLQPSEIEPFEPVFLVKNGSEKVTLSVEGEGTVRNSKVHIIDTESHRYISPIRPGNYLVRDLFDDRNVTIQPVIGLWSDSRKSVVMENTDQAITELWKPVLISRSGDDSSAESRPVADKPFSPESSFIFSLLEIQNENEFLIDEVWVEVDDESNLTSVKQDPAYFTEPFFYMPEVVTDKEPNTTVFFGSYPGNDKSGLSYFRLQTERNTPSEFSLGMFKKGESERINGELRWSVPENVPEEWSIILTDRITGQETDMRIEDHYRFRIQGEPASDSNINSGQKLIQQVEVNTDGNERFGIRLEPPNLTAGGEEDAETPGSIELRQNYPNPFNPSTNITFFLPEERQVRLGIYNIVGQQVATLIDDNIGAGEHSVVWNASNNPSGIYIVQLETGSRILTRKITLVK